MCLVEPDGEDSLAGVPLLQSLDAQDLGLGGPRPEDSLQVLQPQPLPLLEGQPQRQQPWDGPDGVSPLFKHGLQLQNVFGAPCQQAALCLLVGNVFDAPCQQGALCLLVGRPRIKEGDDRLRSKHALPRKQARFWILIGYLFQRYGINCKKKSEYVNTNRTTARKVDMRTFCKMQMSCNTKKTNVFTMIIKCNSC